MGWYWLVSEKERSRKKNRGGDDFGWELSFVQGSISPESYDDTTIQNSRKNKGKRTKNKNLNLTRKKEKKKGKKTRKKKS